MRIAIDAHLLPHGSGYRAAGVASYVKQLTTRLPRIAPQHDYVFFAPPDASGLGVAPSTLPTSHPLVRIFWEQAIEPIALCRRQIDLVHSPVNVSPLLLPCPSVVTIHDLAFLKFPETFVRAKRVYLRALVGASAKRATQVITPSETTRTDVIQRFGLNADHVTVVPEGVGEEFRPDTSTQRPLSQPYLLCVGTVEPRKNLVVLLKAFSRLQALGYPHKLALVGGRGWMFSQIFDAIDALGLSGSVVAPGFVDNLAPWYNHADLLVYPSLYEGFGFPPLEAMACGIPVVTSSAGSLREVAGDAALLVTPSDTDGFVRAISSILDDEALHKRLSRAGLERAALFSWDEMVRKTVGVYESLDRNRRPHAGKTL